MTEHLTDVDQLPSKEEFNAALVTIAKRRFTEANRCFSDGVCECDSCVAGQTLVEEIERLRTTLTGISTCSTCEACRGAARLAIGAPSTTVKPACPECRGGGQICTGNSGREDDGYAPILERCEACDGTGVSETTEATRD